MEKHSDSSHCDPLAVTHTKLIHRQRSQRPISPTTTPPLHQKATDKIKTAIHQVKKT